MSYVTGLVKFEQGRLRVEAVLYNLSGVPGKCMMGLYDSLYIGSEDDYRAVNGNGLIGKRVTCYEAGLQDQRWYSDGAHVLTTWGIGKKWEADVPKPKTRLEVQWQPFTWLSPGWYKRLKKGWVPA